MNEHDRRCLEMQEILQSEDSELLNEFFKANITVAEVLSRYASGERDFIDISLGDNANFRGASLSGANFTGAKMNGADFSESNLTGVNFSYAYLAGANFRNAILRNANLSWSIIAGSNLENTNMEGANIEGIEEYGAFYSNTIMPNGEMYAGPWYSGD